MCDVIQTLNGGHHENAWVYRSPRSTEPLGLCSAFFMLGLMLTVGCTNPAVYIKTTTESAAVAATTDSDLSAINLGFSACPGWFPWQVAKMKAFFKLRVPPLL